MLSTSLLNRNASRGVPGAQQLFHRQREFTLLKEKDEILEERREKYLGDPTTEDTRSSRAALPIAARTQELLDRIQESDATVCIAAT